MLAGERDTNMLGRWVILPSSHIGSPRFLQQLYQDSMAIVRHYGKPTPFITITAYPNWKEVREVLQRDGHGLTAIGRPDSVNRVFQLKVDALIDDLWHHHIFGTHMALCSKLEYQKQGLPHVHLLLFLHENHSDLDPATIEEIISAEFPDKDEEPQLYEIISSAMVHGPCGEENPKCACMIRGPPGNKKCSKGFPKSFSEHTLLAYNGYHVYCRKAGVGTPMTNQTREIELSPRSLITARLHPIHIPLQKI
jgi:hypothetical protein